ncbi:VWA domain-containing protein [Thiomicrorhabdus sp. ZW0627]|uniref:nitric oxide reductase activation protein NorD n=1 Tax=Thiomicrorhabdus sp. ZW0627 TaxID=3039774 RepID=UPI002437254A|nr:VWA domain-containing protein [Thiomicrorhabdus sp. ZW0627]MDG6773695.1 VWA domain-containing protein [Thiomicrorhabdus sp. ZW0627]
MKYKLLLNEVQRQLELTLLAVYEEHFRVLPLSENEIAPAVRAGAIFLPEFIEADSVQEAQQFFLSAALHAAAHLVFSLPTDSSGLNNRQLVLSSLIEDARIERLASQKFPGMAKLFKRNFTKQPTSSLLFEEIAYSVAYALANGSSKFDNPFIEKAVRLFNEAVAEDIHDPNLFKSVGLALANDIGQMRISMNERDEFVLVPYRDDNSYLWDKFEEVASQQDDQSSDVQESVSVTGMGYEEVLDGRSVADYDEKALPDEGLVFKAVEEEVQSQLLSKSKVLSEYSYPEWDYKIARWKRDWCSLNEIVFTERAQDALEHRVDKYRNFVKKLQQIINSYQSEMHRRKKQEDGTELDFESIIQYMVDFKMGSAGAESRIYIDHIKERQHELSLLVLLDLSESMNDPDVDGKNTVLDLTLDSTVVLSELLDSLGHSYALHGFNSNGRGEISYYNIKDFDQDSESSLQSLGLVEAAYSTRLGAALRHAFHKISKRRERHKLILVITDGQPSDIDVYDAQYLIEDSAIAVKEIESAGCKTFCLSLDKNADEYVQKIFRKGHYEVVEQPSKLPQVLTKLYLKVFKSFLA